MKNAINWVIGLAWVVLILSLVVCAGNKAMVADQAALAEDEYEYEYRYVIEVVAPGNVKSFFSCDSFLVERLPHTNRDQYLLYDKSLRLSGTIQVGKNYKVFLNDITLDRGNGNSRLSPGEIK